MWIFFSHNDPDYIIKPHGKKLLILSFTQTLMATDTTHRIPGCPMKAKQKRLTRYRNEGLEKGTYLGAPAEDLVWYTVPATKASYLICAGDAPASEEEESSPSEDVDPASRPAPAELAMILKVFFFITIVIYSAYLSSRSPRTTGSSVLRRIGLPRTRKGTSLPLLTRPKSISSDSHPHTRNSLMTSSKQTPI